MDCEDVVVELSDSASQVSEQRSIMSSSSAVMRRIELERKKEELRNLEELSKLKTRKSKFLAQAEKRKRHALAAAEAEERELLAEVEEEETLLRLRMENMNLEAEEKPLASRSQRSSDIGSLTSNYFRIKDKIIGANRPQKTLYRC